jgi:nucleotide-binding universal stress UspA family protein
MFKNILLAVDGSEHALKAARLAGELARLAGALLGSQSQKVIAHASCPVLLAR